MEDKTPEAEGVVESKLIKVRKPGLKSPKQKGNKFEREVSNILGIVFYNNKDVLKRQPTSGASLWPGDIVPDYDTHVDIFKNSRPSKERHAGGDFPFVIECKHVKDIELSQFIFHLRGFLCGVWMKTENDAIANNSYPIIIAKQNRHTPMLLLRQDAWDYITQLAVLKNSYKTEVYLVNKKYDISVKENPILVLLLDSLQGLEGCLL